MTSSGRTEQRTLINFSIALRNTPSQAMGMLEKAEVKFEVCRTLVYKCHKRFADGRTSTEEYTGPGKTPIN